MEGLAPEEVLSSDTIRPFLYNTIETTQSHAPYLTLLSPHTSGSIVLFLENEVIWVLALVLALSCFLSVKIICEAPDVF